MTPSPYCGRFLDGSKFIHMTLYCWRREGGWKGGGKEHGRKEKGRKRGKEEERREKGMRRERKDGRDDRKMEKTFSSPLKIGQTFQIAIGPKEANCPNANSMKNMGKPQITSIVKYGMRNAPPPFL